MTTWRRTTLELYKLAWSIFKPQQPGRSGIKSHDYAPLTLCWHFTLAKAASYQVASIFQVESSCISISLLMYSRLRVCGANRWDAWLGCCCFSTLKHLKRATGTLVKTLRVASKTVDKLFWLLLTVCVCAKLAAANCTLHKLLLIIVLWKCYSWSSKTAHVSHDSSVLLLRFNFYRLDGWVCFVSR